MCARYIGLQSFLRWLAVPTGHQWLPKFATRRQMWVTCFLPMSSFCSLDKKRISDVQLLFFFFFQRFHQNWSCFLLEDLRLWIHYLFMMYYSSLWTQPAFLEMTKCLESKLSEVLVNNCRVCLQRSMQAVNLNTCRSAVLEIRVCIAKGLENVCFRKCSVGFFFCVLVLQILFIQWLTYAWGVPV